MGERVWAAVRRDTREGTRADVAQVENRDGSPSILDSRVVRGGYTMCTCDWCYEVVQVCKSARAQSMMRYRVLHSRCGGYESRIT